MYIYIFSLRIYIIYRNVSEWQIFKTALSVHSGLIYFSSYWSANTDAFLRKNPQKTSFFCVCSDFTSSIRRALLILLGCDRVAAGFFFSRASSRICSKRHVAFLFSSHLDFPQCFLLASRWCIHTVIPKQPHLGRNPVVFYHFSIWTATFQ